MNIEGLRLAWHMTLQDVIDALGKQNVAQIAANYFSTPPIRLDGITAKLALTFRCNGLCRIELISDGCSSLTDSYEKFQRFLVKSFGSPEATSEVSPVQSGGMELLS